MNRESYQLIDPAKTGPGEDDWFPMSVVSVQGDYLVCNPFNPGGIPFLPATPANPNTNRTVYVMKPWKIQRTPWDGQTDSEGTSYSYSTNAKRTATNGSTTETQYITTDYQVGDLIWAKIVNYTWALQAGPGEGIATSWLDVNNDARAWAVR